MSAWLPVSTRSTFFDEWMDGMDGEGEGGGAIAAAMQ